MIYGPDYDGDGIPDTPDYDNPIHRPDRTTASTTVRTLRTTTAVSIRFGSNKSLQTFKHAKKWNDNDVYK